MGGIVSDVVDTVKDVAGSDLGKAALLAGGAYFGAPYLLGEGALGTGIAELGTATGADLAAAYDMGAVGSLGAGGAAAGSTLSSAAAPSLLGGVVDWAKANPLTAAGAGLAATAALGGGLGSQPSSTTSTTAIDPELKAAYLRNLQEARATAAGLGEKQFAAFPEYSTNMVQKYMNPYQEDVINASMSDIERQRQQQQLRDRAAAVQAKAFGGSRQGVAEALTNEAFQRTAANTAAQLRSQGFTQAQALALQQEEARRQYEQQKLDAARNLGLERLNISSSALGVPLANLGGTQTNPIYRNTSASALGGALSGGMLGNMIGGSSGAGYGALAGGLLGLL